MKKKLKVMTVLLLSMSILVTGLTYASDSVSDNGTEEEAMEPVTEPAAEPEADEEQGEPETEAVPEAAPDEGTEAVSENEASEDSHSHDYVYTYVAGDQHSVLCASCNLEMVLEDCKYDRDGVCVRCGHKREAEADTENRKLEYDGSYKVTVEGSFTEDAELSVEELSADGYSTENEDYISKPVAAFSADVDGDFDDVEISVSGLRSSEGHFAYALYKDTGSLSHIGNFIDGVEFEDSSLGTYVIAELIDGDASDDGKESDVEPIKGSIDSGTVKEAEDILAEKQGKYEIVDSFDLSVPEGTEFPVMLTFDANVDSSMDILILHKASSGWEEIGPDSLGDGEITAIFGSLSPVVIARRISGESESVTVRFFNGETELSSKTYSEGEAIEVPEAPERTEEGKAFTFDGWTEGTDGAVIRPEDIGTAVKDVSYYAHFTETALFTIRWLNKDGSLITKTYCPEGESILAPAENPVYVDKHGVYTFKAWEPQVAGAATGDAEYTASYELKDENKANYRFVWKDYDGRELKNVTGTIDTVDMSKPANPVREKDDLFVYHFKGWKADLTIDEAFDEWKNAGADISKDITVTNTAVYTAYNADTVSYVITFKNWDGTALSKKAYRLGESVLIPTHPERAEDDEYIYEFTGWTPELSDTCKGAVTYTAQYMRETRANKEYTVKFKDYDGTVISEKTYKKGDAIVVPDTPVRKSDEHYDYAFKGWTPAVSASCVKDAEYTAQYTKTAKSEEETYTVTFKDYNGSVISEKTYKKGDTVKVPEDPTRSSDGSYTYEFKGWSPKVSDTVTGNKTYTAQYSKTLIETKHNNTTASDVKKATASSTGNANKTNNKTNTTKTASNTANKTASTGNGNKVKTKEQADKQKVEGSCYITFKDWDDSIISEKAYKKGERIEIPADPVRESDGNYKYTFRNWSPVVSETAEREVTYKAQYLKEMIEQDPAPEMAAEESSKTRESYDEPLTRPETDEEETDTVVSRSKEETVKSGRKTGSIPGFVWGIVLALIIIALIIASIYGHLWFSLWNMLSINKRPIFHGLLLDEDNKFVDCVLPEGDDLFVRTVQEEINEGIEDGEDYDGIKERLLSSEAETILPCDAKMTVTAEYDGESDTSEVMDADEGTLYEMLDELSGQGYAVTADIFSRTSDINISLAFGVI